ncbi:MAG TPA: ACP S-malonyltransferase [Kofleriaceae bacterium]|nr:ACP S-malonyltransferase [Kofleriaceae bacterium]
MIAFLFIGQGADPPWVSPEVLADPAVASLVEHASAATRVDIARLMARGGRELTRTEILQPAMVAVCLGVHRMLERAGVEPAITLGHSLGELCAWCAAGAIGAADAVRLAAIRGALMAREAELHPGGMVRLIGDAATCERAVVEGARVGSICVGAHNGVDEWALSGDEPALACVIARFRATRLPMGGAWHSPAMAGAVDELLAASLAVPRQPMRARMISNRRGHLASDDNAPDLLAGQLVHPVEWVASLETAVALEVRRFVVIGPGKIMRALVYKNLGVDRVVEIADSAATIAAVAAR